MPTPDGKPYLQYGLIACPSCKSTDNAALVNGPFGNALIWCSCGKVYASKFEDSPLELFDFCK